MSSITGLGAPGDFFALLRRQWRLILNSVIAAGVLALAYLLVATPQYAATASLIIDTRGQKILNVEEVLPALTSEIATIESQVEILRSRRIAERALKRISDPGSPPDEAALRNFMHRIDVERKGLSYIIEIKVKDRDRVRAAEIANAIVDAYLQDQLETRQKATRDANEWLKTQVAQTSRELRAAEEMVQQYRAKHGLVDIGEMQLSQREMADLTLQLIAARTKAAEAKARLLQVEQLAKSPDQLVAIGKVIESTVIVDLRRQETEIQRKLGNMISRFGEQHPSVTAARAELETLERDRAQEVNRLVKNAKNDFELTKMQETFLEENLEKLKRQYAERNLITIGLAELEREAEATRQIYTLLLKRLKETQAQESLQTADARVLAYAAVPLSPSSPRKALTLALALVAGLLVGMAAALINENYGSRFLTAEEVERRTGVPVVAEFTGRSALASGESPLPRTKDPSDEYAPAVRRLYEWIEVGTETQTVVVTSATPDQSSALALELADYAARHGTRTLLVDADLKSGRLTSRLSIAAAHSLIDVVRGKVEPADALTKIQGRIDFLPGAGTDHSADIMDVIAPRDIEALFDRMKQKYDLIVANAPAFLSHNEVRPLLAVASKTVFVAQPTPSAAMAISSALQALTIPQSCRLGIVLNKRGPTRADVVGHVSFPQWAASWRIRFLEWASSPKSVAASLGDLIKRHP